jgi:hypothetical protein
LRFEAIAPPGAAEVGQPAQFERQSIHPLTADLRHL